MLCLRLEIKIFMLWIVSLDIVVVCHHNYIWENDIVSVYVGGYCGLSESELCVFCKLWLVSLRVVCKCSSVLLQHIVMPYVNYGGWIGDQMIVRVE